MTDQKELPVTIRTIMGKANKKLLREGLIPGNITGHNQPPQAVQVSAAAIETLRRNRLAANIIRLTMKDAPIQTVLIRHVQHSPSTGKVIHIDFSRVSMDERISAKVALHYVGTAPSVKEKGGVLLHLLDALDIECPASDIADFLEVDISSLTEIDSTLHASDVKLPANFKLVTPPDEPIAKIAPTRAEVKEEAAATATPTTTPEAETKGEA